MKEKTPGAEGRKRGARAEQRREEKGEAEEDPGLLGGWGSDRSFQRSPEAAWVRVGGKWSRGLEFLWGTAEGWGENQPWHQGQWGTQTDIAGGFQLSPEGTEVFSLPLSTCGPSRRAFPPGLGGQRRPSGAFRGAPGPAQRVSWGSGGPHLHQRVGDLVVDLLGEVVHVVGAVEGELLGGLVRGARVLDEALAASGVHCHYRMAVELPLPLVHGAAAHHHLHRLRGHGAAAEAGVPQGRPARDPPAARARGRGQRPRGGGDRAPRGAPGDEEEAGRRGSRRSRAGAAASSRAGLARLPEVRPGRGRGAGGSGGSAL